MCTGLNPRADAQACVCARAGVGGDMLKPSAVSVSRISQVPHVTHAAVGLFLQEFASCEREPDGVSGFEFNPFMRKRAFSEISDMNDFRIPGEVFCKLLAGLFAVLEPATQNHS